MNCPYTKMELMIALISVEGKLEGKDDKLQEALVAIAPEVTTKAGLNVAISEYNGITVQQLIDSPNYKVLVEEYQDNKVCMAISMLERDFGMSNKEAWAMMVAGTDGLN